MKLNELLAGIEVLAATADPETEILGVCYDSRRVRPGELFVAVTGYATDGHAYIGKAVSAGAAAVLCERVPEERIPYIQVKDSRRALAILGANFYRHPSREMTMVAVTGTNGKTTTTYLLKAILEGRGAKVGLIGTNQNMIGGEIVPTERTTPESLELQGLLRQPLGGLIVEGSKTALPNPNLDLYEKLDRTGFPMVFLHGCYRELKNPVCVSDDNFGGGYLAARHLITRGHARIAGIFKSDDIQGHQRYLGYLSAIRDAGLPLADSQVLWYTTEERRFLMDYSHNDMLEHFLQFYLKDCTAVVCYNDEIADRLIRLLLSKSRRVPEDVAVVSFDNSYYSDLCPVRITSLAHEAHKMGGLAAQLLLDQMAGKPVQSSSISWKLVQKASS